VPKARQMIPLLGSSLVICSYPCMVQVPRRWAQHSLPFKQRGQQAGGGGGGAGQAGGGAEVQSGGGLEQASVEESLHLMKFYEMTDSVAHQLYLGAANLESLELLFELNAEEKAVLRYPSSLFLLGR
jgi:hypothetical protein